ncbi:MAG: hypothetical protein IT173_02195 [Acidobacteria bacterium]|nr:hypothetical protein [Acidobacteriota bacterium]
MLQEVKDQQMHRRRSYDKLSARGPAGGYLAAMFVGSFLCALAVYLEAELAAVLIFVLSWIVLPACALTDRLVFDGKRLLRSGLFPRASAYLLGRRFWIGLKDIEQVETAILPALKRGGRVYFRYRTSVRGNGLEFSLASGGGGYRRLAQALFQALPEEVLDAGSIELRDYLSEPKITRDRAKQSEIPSADVLGHVFRNSLKRKGKYAASRPPAASDTKAAGLRRLGNELRFSGSLLQALESFRRAASISPEDPWLLFDFARCIHSFAESERDVRLERRAAAMMRLAERRAGKDGQLLARLGEGYFQLGEWQRARSAFRKAADAVGEQFRSIRGMAEIALRDGKLAHVVHNFGAAERLAESRGARRWSRGEAEYFSRLNSDAEYLEMELGRVNLLDTVDRWRGRAFRLCLVGFPFIGLGIYLGDPAVTNSGWILSGGMIVLWVVTLLAHRVFSPRIAPELLADD